MKKLSVIVCIAAGLTGCSSSFFANNDTLYLKSKNGENIAVPAPLTSENLSHYYDLPPQTQNPQMNIAPPVVVKKAVKQA